MSIARHHNEWLSLIEISGPFLSMPVLMRVFPQGLDPRDPSKARELSIAYEEWRGNPSAPGHHRAWVEFVLTRILEYPKEFIAEDQALPPGTKVVMEIYGEILRPDIAIIGPADTRAAGKPQLLIQIFPHTQNLESPILGRLWKDSPATRMVELLRGTGVLLGLVTNGEEWMLVHAMPGETLGFATWRADIWQEEHITLRAFHCLLHCRCFFGVAEIDTLASLIKESAQDQQEVTDQLGYQVRRAVEVLIQAFDLLDQESGRTLLAGLDEKTIYDAALTLMMRLIFLFCAEERGLLRLGEPLYDDFYAVSTLRERLREIADQQGEEILERRSDAWARLLATFRAVHGGVEHESMRLLAYGGTLFDPDRYQFLEGRPPGTNWRETSAEPPAINNRVVLHLLESLQILRIKVPGGGPAEARRISFRGLDIEQIGHVYESLLDHTAVRAQTVFLGLKGTREAEPELSLELLEKHHAADDDKLIEHLRGETGRSEQALRRDVGLEIILAKRNKKNLQGFSSSEGFSDHILLISCRNDLALLSRIKPFKGLIRSDNFGRPVLIHPGSIFVTKGSERRATGTHYTPRSLTEPIVQHTLEPLVYIGPAEGSPKDQWKLRSPREILELKVCDMAMGSGAFLVQACRYLAERLAEAWEQLEKANPDKILSTPEGNLSSGHPSERLIPLDPDERLAIARRYVADRCLYGVDVNPMAVEMAKLSLWLITVQRDRPFTFLDHSLKCGDSLLGVSDLKQVENFTLRAKPDETIQHTFATANLFHYVEEASVKRLALEKLSSNDFAQIETKNRLNSEAEAFIAKVKALADCLIAFELLGFKGRAYDKQRVLAAERTESAMQQSLEEFLAYALGQLQGRRTFHWQVEFPEVFDRGGFDGFIGNPPFMGGRLIGRILGMDYQDYLRIIRNDVRGSPDLCAYFMLRAFQLMCPNGCLGLLGTKSIAETGSRVVALDQIIVRGGNIYRAFSRVHWPGAASVVVAVVWIMKRAWKGVVILDDLKVVQINGGLEETFHNKRPKRLVELQGAYSQGQDIMGRGFELTEEEMQTLIARDPKSKEVIFPLFNGQDLNNMFELKPYRWVIYFRDWPEEKAREYWAAFQRVESLVKPYRERLTGQIHQTCFWKFWDLRHSLMKEFAEHSYVLGSAIVTKYVSFRRVPTSNVYNTKTKLYFLYDWADFAMLQSSFHQDWAFWLCGTLGAVTLNYSTSAALETWPMPQASGMWRSYGSLRSSGEKYHELREEIIKSRKEGLTKTYNRFHDPGESSEDILRLRSDQEEMDRVVAAAYGWSDLDLGHGYHETKQGVRYTLSEPARRQILDRLLDLNHKRYEEEAKMGLHEKKRRTENRMNKHDSSTGEIIF